MILLIKALNRYRRLVIKRRKRRGGLLSAMSLGILLRKMMKINKMILIINSRKNRRRTMRINRSVPECKVIIMKMNNLLMIQK